MMENAEELHDDPTMLPPVPGPKYEQVIRYLEQKYVIPGSPGDKLPTERAIQEKFKVSRQTVRNAIKALLERGLIYNVQGCFHAHHAVFDCVLAMVVRIFA